MAIDIQALRARLDALKSEVSSLKNGQVLAPETELTARIDAFMTHAVAVGEKLITRSADEAVFHGQVPLDLFIWKQPYEPQQIAGLLAALAPKALRAALLAQVKQRIAEAPATMTEAERQARIVEIEGQILEIEKVEHASVEKAQAAGQRIDFREDTDPRVLLGIA